jgi:lysozyme family protein
MADFNTALKVLDELEGGWSTQKFDKGGVTRAGISLRFLQTQTALSGDFDHDGKISAHDLQAMTQLERDDLLKAVFWTPLKLDKITAQRIGTLLFCQAVNLGAMEAVILLQQALMQINPRLKLRLDGLLGPLTIAATNARAATDLLSTYKVLNAKYYAHIVERDKTQSVFYGGWLHRLAKL